MATLKKGGVDTFLFLSFAYSEAQDLRGADSFVLESRVPEGQQASARLLVLLTEKDGAQYFAEAGWPLSAAGPARTRVPPARFGPVPGAKDPDGRFDPDQIVAVAIGWRGYYGAVGEVVEFAVAPPRVLWKRR